MIVIVPNELRDAINKLLDKKLPKEAEAHREDFYNQLLSYYNDNGVLPEFQIERKVS